MGLNSSAVARCQPATDSPADVSGATGTTEAVSDEQLFQDLEDDKFEVRENATYQLAKRGATVLPQIASRYFTAPPETVYRIRKILEGVGSSGDEQTFLRATSLLLTLYSNGNKEMVQRIEQLKADWRTRRKDEAVQAILAAGGKVVSEYNSQPHLGQALVNRHVIKVIPNQAANKAPKKEKLDVDQQRELVAKILSNSADDNRDFILKQSRGTGLSKPKATQYTYNAPQPLSVEFPDGWVANEGVLLRLSDLDGPVALKLGAIEMNDAHWRVVKNTEDIISVDLSTDALPDSATAALPLDLRAITLRNCSPEPDFCKSLGEFSSLGVLHLSNCKLDADSVAALNQLKRVSTIPVGFSDVKVDADSIAALARLKRVRAIEMKNAEVSAAALAELEELPQISSLKLSRIRIEFQPKAFLGVGPQGGGRADRIGCQIAYIAPNSSAAREGIRVGDVIRSIDGDPVKTFQEVRLKIAQYDPGEKMPMTIQRADEMLELDVELGKNSSVE